MGGVGGDGRGRKGEERARKGNTIKRGKYGKKEGVKEREREEGQWIIGWKGGETREGKGERGCERKEKG